MIAQTPNSGSVRGQVAMVTDTQYLTSQPSPLFVCESLQHTQTHTCQSVPSGFCFKTLNKWNNWFRWKIKWSEWCHVTHLGDDSMCVCVCVCVYLLQTGRCCTDVWCRGWRRWPGGGSFRSHGCCGNEILMLICGRRWGESRGSRAMTSLHLWEEKFLGHIHHTLVM